MKAYVKCPPKLSRAMYRVANALERYAPADVEIVQTEAEADLLVLHVIGLEAIEYRLDKPCAVMQYCTGGGIDLRPWYPLWNRASLVWSYYNLNDYFEKDIVGNTKRFYHAPLGIEPLFRKQTPEGIRDYTVLTSGYVNGMPQEAIEEPTLAALALGGKPVHLGKIPVGLTRAIELNLAHDLTDAQLLDLYRRCAWVAGLRYVEGFEMGVVEGLAQGARPVVFDRPDNRHWFGDHAVFVPECTGDELTAVLTEVFTYYPAPVVAEERAIVLEKFNWKTLVTEFWNRLKENA